MVRIHGVPWGSQTPTLGMCFETVAASIANANAREVNEGHRCCIILYIFLGDIYTCSFLAETLHDDDSHSRLVWDMTVGHVGSLSRDTLLGLLVYLLDPIF